MIYTLQLYTTFLFYLFRKERIQVKYTQLYEWLCRTPKIDSNTSMFIHATI